MWVFGPMIMKQAIEYNLGGYAKNEPNDVVSFTLQGEAKRLEDAAAAIREGTKKSSNIEVKTTPGNSIRRSTPSRSLPGRRRPVTSPIPMISSSGCGPTTTSFPAPRSKRFGTAS